MTLRYVVTIPRRTAQPDQRKYGENNDEIVRLIVQEIRAQSIVPFFQVVVGGKLEGGLRCDFANDAARTPVARSRSDCADVGSRRHRSQGTYLTSGLFIDFFCTASGVVHAIAHRIDFLAQLFRHFVEILFELFAQRYLE